MLGFTLTSLWCGLAQSGAELIIARLAQGATAALMVPQVLATLHLLFTDGQRSRAFAIYGIVLGLAGAAGFLLGGLLITVDLAGTGWRSVFFVNVPCGLVIAVAAWRIMRTLTTSSQRRPSPLCEPLARFRVAVREAHSGDDLGSERQELVAQRHFLSDLPALVSGRRR